MDRPNLLPPLLYIVFYMFLAFPLTFFLLVPTRTLNCVAIFYPLHWVFQDLRTGKRIGLGCENGRGIYELMSDTPSSGLLDLFSSSSTISSILWHRRLGHPCLSKLKKTLPRLIIIQNHANIHLSSFSCIKAHEFHDINILIGMLLQIFEVTIFFVIFQIILILHASLSLKHKILIRKQMKLMKEMK